MKKTIVKALLAVLIIAALSTTSFAYLDPSVLTYVIQAVAGIIIAVGAVAGIYWRKARKKVAQTLNIDENKNKEVEEDIVVYEDENKEA